MGGSYEFLKRASLDAKDGTISIQFPAMLEVTKKNGGTIDPEEGEVSTRSLFTLPQTYFPMLHQH